MTTIYVISGSTGEYSDRHDWMVEAHTTEDAAKARVSQLGSLMQEVGATGEHMEWKKRGVAIDAMKSHVHGDPYFSLDYTGTSYGYSECTLVAP